MVETKARKEKLEAAKKLLNEVVAVDPESLARTDELSRNINFAQSVPHFQRTQDMFRELHSRDISRLPSDSIDHVNQACSVFMSLVQKIRSFDINTNNPADACRAINNEVANAYDGIAKPLLLPLSFTATQQTNYAQIEREAKGFNAELRQQHSEMLAFIDQVKASADQALAAVREQAAEAGVASNAQIFVQEANKRAQSAVIWLRWTVVLTALTALAALTFLGAVFYWTPAGTPQAIQYVISKLILLSVLSFSTVWCARNYRAHKHNETLNAHRAHALMTFRAFVEGTKDPRVSDAVLVQASTAAFQGRPTGYETMSDTTSHAGPVIEVLSRAAGRAATTGASS